MNYELTFTDSGERALERLEGEERERVEQKLGRIAGCQYRHPTEWGFTQMKGRAEGRFSITDGLRVFADVDEQRGIIRIHHIGRRENLYT